MEAVNSLDIYVLGPYIKLARTMIAIPRSIGRNAFTHAIGTMAIAIDYNYYQPIILKGCLLHDYLEDTPWAKESDIINCDEQGPEVLNIVKELTWDKNNESKQDYLIRIYNTTHIEVKIIKLCDRIDNLYTLIPAGSLDKEKIKRILKETEDFILPIAEQVSIDFVKEISDLIASRKKLLYNL